MLADFAQKEKNHLSGGRFIHTDTGTSFPNFSFSNFCMGMPVCPWVYEDVCSSISCQAVVAQDKVETYTKT